MVPSAGNGILDVAVVGAGHNALIAAAYLVRAGKRVAVFERAARAGGAVQTRNDIFPGYRIDVGSSAHILIHLTPVLEELELARYGLRYIDCDPWSFYPLEDGRSLFFWKDIDRTCESIAAISPRDADAYRRFCAEWRPISRAVLQTFLNPPKPGKVAWTMARSGGFARGGLPKLQQILGSYRALLNSTFEHPAVRAAIEWIAAQSGPPPGELGSAPLAGWQVLYHESGVKRAVGGSGALSEALVRLIEDHGGEVHTGRPVRRILVERGRAAGLEVGEGVEPGLPLAAGPTPPGRTEIVRAGGVLAGCHIATTFGRLLSGVPEAAPMRERVGQLRIGNGFGMILRCTTSELPHYAGWEGSQAEGGSGAPGPMHQGLQLLCSPAPFLDDAYADFLRGEPAREPAVVAMTWSAVDPSLAPAGKHLLFAWAQYHPYALANGQSWSAIREREAERILGTVGRFAPNVPTCVEQMHIQTPPDLEREIGLFNGNVMHLEMSLDQMFFFRPLPELSGYTTPIHGLFLTGASTHPGGGVFGASGRSAAGVVLKGLR
ncbi:MAG: NAD(P)/FAD-dependent oxidoreductase [Gemmatimonadetes bacterium]|nr:NAD(P)/FAD-dependent oxidoreductase [Gemmatimonadota bacterium]